MKLKTSEDHQQIGELSRSLGVTTRTLRLYEQMGLIDPPQRTEGRIRYYTKEDIRRIRFVLKLKELGLSLQQMQELAEIYRETKMPDTIMPRLIELLDSHTDAIHRKIGKRSPPARARGTGSSQGSSRCAKRPPCRRWTGRCPPCRPQGSRR